MSLRFRRRIKILPGVHLNISRTGISTSLGVRGASVSIGKRGTYMNTGIPGTGISSRTRIDASSSHYTTTPTPQEAVRTHHLHWWKVLVFLTTMVIAGATKSNVAIGCFWMGWAGYWVFLFLRLGFRRMSERT